MLREVTLSNMECEAVARHLGVQREILGASHSDASVLEHLIARVCVSNTITLSRTEVFCALIYLRKQVGSLCALMMAIEERQMRGGHNGDLTREYQGLDQDSVWLSNVIRILWTFTQ